MVRRDSAGLVRPHPGRRRAGSTGRRPGRRDSGDLRALRAARRRGAEIPRSGALDEHARRVTDLGRHVHRDLVQTVFAPKLEARPQVGREALVDLLAVATDVYTWKQLRRDRKLDRAAAERRALGIAADLQRRGDTGNPSSMPWPTCRCGRAGAQPAAGHHADAPDARPADDRKGSAGAGCRSGRCQDRGTVADPCRRGPAARRRIAPGGCRAAGCQPDAMK